MSTSTSTAVLERCVDQARQDAVDLVGLVRHAGAEGVAAHLAALAPARKEALLVALACAVDVDRTAGQWWSWLGTPSPPPVAHRSPVRPVPRALDVHRFACAHGLSDDQVWRAVIDLHAGATADHTPSAGQQ